MLKTDREQIIFQAMRKHEGVTGSQDRQVWECSGCKFELCKFGSESANTFNGAVLLFKAHQAAEIEKAIKILDPEP